MRGKEWKLQREVRLGKQAARSDGQMDEEADGWVDGGIGGIALGGGIKPQINSLTGPDVELQPKCKSHIMIWTFVTASYLLICHHSGGGCYVSIPDG